MKQAFNFSLDDYYFFGGYPGAAYLIGDFPRWCSYIRTALIDTVINKDILLLARIDKPTLLRQFFLTVCSYPAQIVSLNKFLGQLENAGNVTSLANYASLLQSAYLITPLEKYNGATTKMRSSQPKWIISNNALLTALSDQKPEDSRRSSWYGRLVENAVAQHLILLADKVFYWHHNNMEVDYVVKVGKSVYAIEVKAGERLRTKSGLAAFLKTYPKAKPMVIGGDGISIEEFLT